MALFGIRLLWSFILLESLVNKRVETEAASVSMASFPVSSRTNFSTKEADLRSADLICLNTGTPHHFKEFNQIYLISSTEYIPMTYKEAELLIQKIQERIESLLDGSKMIDELHFMFHIDKYGCMSLKYSSNNIHHDKNESPYILLFVSPESERQPPLNLNDSLHQLLLRLNFKVLKFNIKFNSANIENYIEKLIKLKSIPVFEASNSSYQKVIEDLVLKVLPNDKISGRAEFESQGRKRTLYVIPTKRNMLNEKLHGDLYRRVTAGTMKPLWKEVLLKDVNFDELPSNKENTREVSFIKSSTESEDDFPKTEEQWDDLINKRIILAKECDDQPSEEWDESVEVTEKYNRRGKRESLLKGRTTDDGTPVLKKRGGRDNLNRKIIKMVMNKRRCKKIRRKKKTTTKKPDGQPGQSTTKKSSASVTVSWEGATVLTLAVILDKKILFSGFNNFLNTLQTTFAAYCSVFHRFR